MTRLGSWRLEALDAEVISSFGPSERRLWWFKSNQLQYNSLTWAPIDNALITILKLLYFHLVIQSVSINLKIMSSPNDIKKDDSENGNISLSDADLAQVGQSCVNTLINLYKWGSPSGPSRLILGDLDPSISSQIVPWFIMHFGIRLSPFQCSIPHFQCRTASRRENAIFYPSLSPTRLHLRSLSNETQNSRLSKNSNVRFSTTVFLNSQVVLPPGYAYASATPLPCLCLSRLASASLVQLNHAHVKRPFSASASPCKKRKWEISDNSICRRRKDSTDAWIQPHESREKDRWPFG